MSQVKRPLNALQKAINKEVSVRLKMDLEYRGKMTNVDPYTKGTMVNGDVSEYNILFDGEMPWIIDWPQYVTSNHPNAKELLSRDNATNRSGLSEWLNLSRAPPSMEYTPLRKYP